MNLVVREAVLAFRRAPLLSSLSVTTIAFSLFVVGLFGLVAINLQKSLTTIAERVEIVAYLLPGTPIEASTLALKDIEAFPEVASAVFVTEDEAMQRARRELAEIRDLYRELERNPLPASIEVRLEPGFRDVAHVEEVAERLRGFGFVEDVRYGEDWIVKLYRIRNIATAAGVILGAAFAAVSIIIIGATIRMTVLAREREISIMRLVGATDGFVRRPFLIEGFAKGVLGGVVALVLTWFANTLISRAFIQTDFFPVQVALVGVLAGALIGTLGSALSVGRHLRKVK